MKHAATALQVMLLLSGIAWILYTVIGWLMLASIETPPPTLAECIARQITFIRALRLR